MITRLNLKRGEGKLVGAGSLVRSGIRREKLLQFPQKYSPPILVEISLSMSHEGGVDNMS